MKKYGIRGGLAPDHPMRASHLIGEDWEWSKWFDSEQERDRVFDEMNKELQYYRSGDVVGRTLTKIER